MLRWAILGSSHGSFPFSINLLLHLRKLIIPLRGRRSLHPVEVVNIVCDGILHHIILEEVKRIPTSIPANPSLSMPLSRLNTPTTAFKKLKKINSKIRKKFHFFDEFFIYYFAAP